MSASVKRTIIAISAAVIMSVVTVGATVSPVQASSLQASRGAHA